MSATLRPGDLTLVTGGSGFLGSAVVRALIARGVRVRALVRASSPRDHFRGLDCEVVVGDLTDRKTLKAALKDCLLYTSPSPRDKRQSRMPSSA